MKTTVVLVVLMLASLMLAVLAGIRPPPLVAKPIVAEATV